VPNGRALLSQALKLFCLLSQLLKLSIGFAEMSGHGGQGCEASRGGAGSWGVGATATGHHDVRVLRWRRRGACPASGRLVRRAPKDQAPRHAWARAPQPRSLTNALRRSPDTP